MKKDTRIQKEQSKKRVNNQGENTPAAAQIESDQNIEPFGPIKATHDVEMARYHIRDVWETVLTRKTSEAMGGALPALSYCIEHHPGLRVEHEGLDAMSRGYNNLIGLASAAAKDNSKWTGSQLWLARKINTSARCSLAEFLAMIEDAYTIFSRDPATKETAMDIKLILAGWRIVKDMRGWLDSI